MKYSIKLNDLVDIYLLYVTHKATLTCSKVKVSAVVLAKVKAFRGQHFSPDDNENI